MFAACWSYHVVNKLTYTEDRRYARHTPPTLNFPFLGTEGSVCPACQLQLHLPITGMISIARSTSDPTPAPRAGTGAILRAVIGGSLKSWNFMLWAQWAEDLPFQSKYHFHCY
jgi:hypothetical protein